MNTVQILPILNSIEISILDIYTTTYFLQAHTMLDEHAPAKPEPEEPKEPEEGDIEDEL